MAPSSHINHTGKGSPRDAAHNWEDFTHQRLWWLYGPDRAYAILKGNDHATNCDLDAWARLGRKAAA